jgi:hypothetical protein
MDTRFHSLITRDFLVIKVKFDPSSYLLHEVIIELVANTATNPTRNNFFINVFFLKLLKNLTEEKLFTRQKDFTFVEV